MPRWVGYLSAGYAHQPPTACRLHPVPDERHRSVDLSDGRTAGAPRRHERRVDSRPLEVLVPVHDMDRCIPTIGVVERSAGVPFGDRGDGSKNDFGRASPRSLHVTDPETGHSDGVRVARERDYIGEADLRVLRAL